MKVVIVGAFPAGALEVSYAQAFETLGCEVVKFDLRAATERYCRLGRFGRLLNRFVPVEAWIHKANREMIITVLRERPRLLLTVGGCSVQAGALAQFKTALNPALVHIWPDTLLNLKDRLATCLPLFDLVATYSQTSVLQFQRLGARNVAWVPLAGDLTLHPPQATEKAESAYSADVRFIGGWRPEREAALSRLTRFKLKIWGPDWNRRCRHNPTVLLAWQGRPLRGLEFSKAVAHSKVNLNIIDDTNHPAANMRFFEIPAAGGLEVCSPCPEMEREFLNGEHLFYYQKDEELPRLVESLLRDGGLRTKVAQAGHQLLTAKHTYTRRAEQILDWLKLNCGDGAWQ